MEGLMDKLLPRLHPDFLAKSLVQLCPFNDLLSPMLAVSFGYNFTLLKILI